MGMSFTEKSTWASLAIILLVFTGYFSSVFEGLMDGTLSKPETFGLFMGALVMLIVLEVALHIVLALVNAREANQAADERDKLIAMRAGNISGWVLAIGVLGIAAQTFIYDLNSLWMANLLLFTVYVSQVVCYVLQLFFYRRGF